MRVFVIVTYRREELFGRCLSSLVAANAGSAGWGVVIVHNGGPAPMRASILASCAADQRMRPVLLPENLTFSAAANAGLREALSMGASVVVLVNDDIEFFGPVIPALDAAMAEPSVGVVGAKLLYPNGTIQHAGMRRVGPHIHHRFHGAAGACPEANAPADVCVTGALVAFRRDLIDKIGLLDEGFRMGSEDVDYCVRTLKAGFRVVYRPSFAAIHLEGATRGRSDREKGPVMAAADRQGRRRLVEKWGGFLREAVKVEGAPDIVYACADHTSPAADVALMDCERMSARGFPCRIASSADPGDMAWLLRRSSGVKVACGWPEACCVAESLGSGDRGFLLVAPGGSLPAGAASVLAKVRPLLVSRDEAFALWRAQGADTAIIPASGDERWDALEDLFWGAASGPLGSRAPSKPQTRPSRPPQTAVGTGMNDYRTVQKTSQRAVAMGSEAPPTHPKGSYRIGEQAPGPVYSTKDTMEARRNSPSPDAQTHIGRIKMAKALGDLSEAAGFTPSPPARPAPPAPPVASVRKAQRIEIPAPGRQFTPSSPARPSPPAPPVASVMRAQRIKAPAPGRQFTASPKRRGPS